MIITIGREKGSGGHYAGELLAKFLVAFTKNPPFIVFIGICK